MIDPELVLEKIVVNPDNSHYSYMGNPLKVLIAYIKEGESFPILYNQNSECRKGWLC